MTLPRPLPPPFRLAGRPVHLGGATTDAGLLPAERALLGPRATDKRRAELRAGRLAARAALRRLGVPDPAHVPILREPGGRPYAADPASGAPLPVSLSITHAGGRALCAAAMGDLRLGLDLVCVEPLGEAFAREAFAPGELPAWRDLLAALPAADAADRAVAAAFAAKEAALKWIGCGLRLPLQALRVTPQGGAARQGGFQMKTAVRWEDRTAVLSGWCFVGEGLVWVALWTRATTGTYQPSRSL